MLCNLAFMHPRLLFTMVLLDPVIQPQAAVTPNPAQLSAFRRDLWPSRTDAETSFRKQTYYQAWDPQVFDRWCEYGIRETPTRLYPDEQGSVTLTTTKHQECFTFLRPSWEGMSEDGRRVVNHDLVPDMQQDGMMTYPFYRPEPPNTLIRLPELRPSALYIFGEMSPMSSAAARKLKLEWTGTGLGGSGGKAAGRVQEVVLRGIGHLVAMEAPGECAMATAAWLGQELTRFADEKKQYLRWTEGSPRAKTTLSGEWLRRIGGAPNRSSKPGSKM